MRGGSSPQTNLFYFFLCSTFNLTQTRRYYSPLSSYQTQSNSFRRRKTRCFHRSSGCCPVGRSSGWDSCQMSDARPDAAAEAISGPMVLRYEPSRRCSDQPAAANTPLLSLRLIQIPCFYRHGEHLIIAALRTASVIR